MKKALIFSLLSAVIILVGCTISKNTPVNNDQAGMANPASINCEQKGGTLEIRTDATSGQVGYCKFSDGSECEEWAFFRGECQPGAKDQATDWQTYTDFKLGVQFQYPKIWPGPKVENYSYSDGGYFLGEQKSLWRINVGNNMPEIDKEYYPLFVEFFPVKNYDSVLKDLRADELIGDIQENIINGNKAITYGESGESDINRILIFFSNGTIRISNRELDSNTELRFAKSFKFIK